MAAIRLFLADCIHERKTHAAGEALLKRSVLPMATMGGDAADGMLQIRRRSALTLDNLDPGLNDAEIQQVVEHLLVSYINGNQREDIDRLLVAHPAFIHAPLALVGGVNALGLACEAGHVEIVSWLMGLGADIHHLCNRGSSALHIACTYGHVEVVRLLLNNGAKIHQTLPQAKEAMTPLHIACELGHAETVELLLERGASITATTARGETAMALAQAKGDDHIVDLLSAHAAQPVGPIGNDEAVVVY